MKGVATPAQIAAFGVSMKMKRPTAAEVGELADTMLSNSRRLPTQKIGTDTVDIVGTGGDGANTVNLSTMASIVVAATGVPVVKHGNRAASSLSGGADTLEALGVRIDLEPDEVARCVSEIGIGFAFAPLFHPSYRHAVSARREIGVPTVFNLLGPLTNPAAPAFGLIGACDLPTARLLADALSGMPIQRAFVVYGEPGWDEATPVGPFVVFDVRPGVVRRGRRDPAHYGIPRCTAADLAGGDATSNARAIEAVLCGDDRGPHRDALLLGAGLVLDLTGRARGLRRGIEAARRALDSGEGARLLARLRAWQPAAS